MATPDDLTKRSLAIGGQVAFVLLAAFIVYAFVAVTREGETHRRCTAACLLHPEYMGASRMAPNFTLKNIRGQSVTLADYRGKVVVMNFWSKTCGPCLEEMDALVELTKILQERSDVVMLTVTFDEDPNDVQQTLRAILHGDPPFQVLFDPEKTFVKGKYGTELVPETWVIDKRGVVRARFDGAKKTARGEHIWRDATVVEFIDQIRQGSYCPVEINGGLTTAEQVRFIAQMIEAGSWHPGSSENELAQAWGVAPGDVANRAKEASQGGQPAGVCDALVHN